MKRIVKRIISVCVASAVCSCAAFTSFAAGDIYGNESAYSVGSIEASEALASSNSSGATINLSKTEVSLNVGGSSDRVNVTVSGGASGDTVKVQSKTPAIAAVEYSNNVITITPGAAGVVPVTVSCGKQKAQITVTVTGKAPVAKSFKFYSDKEKTKVLTKAEGLWANGGMVKQEDGTKVNYKDITVYTDFEPVLMDPKPLDSKVESKAGKTVVAVTKTDVTKLPYENKKVIKDDEASKIVKASYKKGGEIKLTGVTSGGSAKVWLIDVAADGTVMNHNSFLVELKAAAANISVYDKSGTAVKKTGLAAGQSETFTFKGFLKDKKTEAKDATYSVIVDKKYTENIQVSYNKGSDSFTVKALKTNDGKVVNAKVSVVCDQSGKSAAVSISVTNPVQTISTAIVDGQPILLQWKGDSTQIAVTETGVEEGKTTDKVSVCISDDKETPLTVDEKGKVVFKKSKAASGTYKNGILTLKRDDPRAEGTVYLVYTDSATKKSKVFKVCDIQAIVIVGGGVSLV